ncbi:unnamed protein product [Closterium sp. NIES-64]|nr:unnamed protein product [Closterium sp. NIES-64]
MTSPKDFRYHLRETQPFSIPLAPKRPTRAVYEFSLKVPVPEAAARLGVPPHMHFQLKCDVAPLLCAETMILEWMAEPRVGVLMDLGRIRSCLPDILRARRQREKDVLASMLVQILGVKESRDLEEGFGVAMQNLLSGGLEKAHAERWGGAGKGVAGASKGKRQMENDGNPEGSWETMDGGGGGGRDGKGGKWREHLKGHVWERYVDGMAWILEHGGGEGREFRCSHCSGGDSSSGASSSSSSSSSNLEGTEIPKGMYVSGIGATDFAICVASVLSSPQYRWETNLYLQDGNTASKTWVEDAAIETARERLRRRAQGEGGAAGRGVGTTASASPSAVAAAFANPTPVNTNPVVAVFTYRAACVLQWARTYGSEVIPASQCCKDSPQGKVRPMRHPLRDLPSLLVRLGAIPKPVDQGSFAWDWEEWPQGDEAAAKLPDDLSARFFRLGIVEEASGPAGEHGAGGEKVKRRRQDWGHERLLQQLLTKLRPLVQRKYPIVRCTADADFLLEFAGNLVKPPACAQCKPCLAVYSRSIPFLTLIANYAYRPASIIFNRFVSLFPPLSPEFDRVAARMGVPPFPASVPGFLRSALLHNQAELDPVLFLLAVAPKWAAPILGITDRKDLHKLRDGEGADGRVWEEVQMWWLAVEFAWQGTMKLEAEALSDTCQGREERAARDGVQGEEVTSDKWRKLWKRAAKPRFCEDVDSEKRLSEIISESSNLSDIFGSSSSSHGNDSDNGGRRTKGDDGKGKQGDEPAYLKPWPGGVNLLACLREMLLGEPCYRPASPTAPSTPAASSAHVSSSACAAAAAPFSHAAPSSSATPDHASAPIAVARGTGPAASGGERVCGAVGCGTVGGGGGVRLKSCGGCGKVAYCSRECQKAHWPSHKLTCPGRTSGKKSGTTSGKVSASGNVSGNVSDNVSGNVSGNVSDNVSDNVSGNVSGNVSDNVSGNVSATM